MKEYKYNPTKKRRSVPLTQLSTVEDIVTSEPTEECPMCGEEKKQSELNEHVYEECDMKYAMDEVRSIRDMREAKRELREILTQRGF